MEDTVLVVDVDRNERADANLRAQKAAENVQIEEVEAGGNPPDGGARAWFVMIGSFLCNGILLGVINSFGVIHFQLEKELKESGDTEASSKSALVGSLAIGTMFLLSPVAGILTDRVGLRRITFIGGTLAALGMLLSSFFCHSVRSLYFTYGIMFGLGAALAYTPSLAILGHYFKRYLGLVNGIVTAGSSVFTIIMPVLLDYILSTASLAVALRVLSLMSCFIIFCALLFKPQTKAEKFTDKRDFKSVAKSLINVDNWKRKKYVIWAFAIPSALFGYFVPYVHMTSFVNKTFNRTTNLPVMCIGITSGLGRLIFGYIADLPGVNRILLQQISFYSIGIVSMCLPFAHYYGLLLVFTLAMGLFDGCFISLLGPIAFDLCGQRGGTQAIGFLLGLCSVPLTLGPPIAGLIYDHTQSYTLPLLLAGIPPLVGATIMFLVRCVDDPPLEDKNANGTQLTSNAWQNDDEFSDKRNGCSHPSKAVPLTALVTPGTISWQFCSMPYHILSPARCTTPTKFQTNSDDIINLETPLLSANASNGMSKFNKSLLPCQASTAYFSCPSSNDFLSENPIWPLSLKSHPTKDLEIPNVNIYHKRYYTAL